MNDRRDLRIERIVDPFTGVVRTDGYTPFVFVAAMGEIYYDIHASNMAEPYTYGDDDTSFCLPDAPAPIIQFEFRSLDHADICRIELRRIPPLGTERRTSAARTLTLEGVPVVALDRFEQPRRHDDRIDVGVVRDVFLEILPDHYRISWERESPTTIFDCGPVRFGSVGATIVCLDIRRAGLELTDEFDRRIAEGPEKTWPAASSTDLHAEHFEHG